MKRFLFFPRGYPDISLTHEGNKSVIYDRSSPLFNLYKNAVYACVSSLDRLVLPHSLYSLTNDTDLVSPVAIQAASFS